MMVFIYLLKDTLNLMCFSSILFIIFQKRKSEANKDLELHQTVTAVIEIVKDNYLASTPL